MTEQIGRYQLIAHPAGYVLLFIDTATGRLWEYHADDKVWDEMKNPMSLLFYAGRDTQFPN